MAPPVATHGSFSAAAEAGHALIRHAAGIFSRIDGAEQELGEIAGRRDSRLRVGSFPTCLATILPPAFARFRRRHGDVILTVVDDHLQRLVPRIDAGELDLALIHDNGPAVRAMLESVQTAAAGLR